MPEETSGIPEKFEEIKTEIEKAIIPHITVKISMPEGTDKEEFLKLEGDEEFLHALEGFTKKWLKKRKRADLPIIDHYDSMLS